MKLLKVIALFFSTMMFAQATRFVYQVTMKPDSLNRNDVKIENANLDVTPSGSIFYAANTIQRDSLFTRMRQTHQFNAQAFQNLRSNIPYIITKDYTNQTITFQDRIGRSQYQYTETDPFHWKILPQTLKIGDYNTQEAETTYGGRTWKVWFTTDVPFFDGPYKFSGLPGLIVKAEDSKGDYSFDLMQTKKIPAPFDVQSFGQVIKISKDKFEKTEQSYQKDPIAFMQASFNGGFGRGGRGGGPNFNRNNNPQAQRQREQQLLDQIKKNNNPIELK